MSYPRTPVHPSPPGFAYASHPCPASDLGNEICGITDTGCLEDIVDWVRKHPGRLNIHGTRYMSPLMVAATNPVHLPIVRFLLSAGANPHYTVGGNELGATALHVAAARGNVYGLALLLAAGADPLRLDSMGRSPLHCASTAGSVACVRRLLRAILHRVTVVALAWDENGGLRGLSDLPPGVPGMGLGEMSPVTAAATLMSAVTYISRSIAASGENLATVLSNMASAGVGQLQHGAPMGGPSAFTAAGGGSSRGGWGGGGGSSGGGAGSSSHFYSSRLRALPTPAQRAVAMSELRTAVADAVTGILNAQDDSGYTCLMLAAEHGREEVVKTLLAAGASVHSRNKLLHSALGVREPWRGPPPSLFYTRALSHTHLSLSLSLSVCVSRTQKPLYATVCSLLTGMGTGLYAFFWMRITLAFKTPRAPLRGTQGQLPSPNGRPGTAPQRAQARAGPRGCMYPCPSIAPAQRPRC
jgi:hypothetical protein